jgi:hypothetical protein
MTESEPASGLSRFVRQIVVATPHAPPERTESGPHVFRGYATFRAGGQFDIANTVNISNDSLDGNRKTRAGR